MQRQVVVWRFSDGKRGHDNQSLGLIEALAAQIAVAHHEVQASPVRVLLMALPGRRFPPAAHLPHPDLIVGAGHATHLPMLAARRARGGRVIVLMKPSLPRRWFDLCIIPRHDGVEEAEGVLVTDGALNRITPASSLEPERGLILLGGPSAHYRWEDEGVREQLRAVLDATPEVRWQIADSRRTPPAFMQTLRKIGPPETEYVHHADAPPEWLRGQFARCKTVWVTPDSVSMIYEAITAGAAVGLLELSAAGSTRVAAGIDQLLRAGRATRYSDWRNGAALHAAREPLHEAARCARWIRQHWLSC